MNRYSLTHLLTHSPNHAGCTGSKTHTVASLIFTRSEGYNAEDYAYKLPSAGIDAASASMQILFPPRE